MVIFDLSGGKWDRVMGNYANNARNSEFDATAGTGFFSQPSNQKYYDLYPSDIFNGDDSTNVTKCSIATCGGHALFETKSWHGDYGRFVFSTDPWFGRGGFCEHTSDAGVFRNGVNVGSSSIYYSFRSVLLPQ